MWLKIAQEKLIERYTPRSKFIGEVEVETQDDILGDKILEDYALQHPDDTPAEVSVEIFGRHGEDKEYVYPYEDLETGREIGYTGGVAFHSNNMRYRPFYRTR